MDEKSRHISTVTIIVLSILIEYFMCINDVGLYRHAERALSRIPVFMLGLLMSSRVYSSPAIKKIEVVIWMLVGAILFALVSFHPLHIVLVRYLYCFIGMALIVCYSFLRCYFGFNSGGMILNMLGSISLELYVVHVLIIRVINVNCYWQMLHKWCWYLLIPFVSITIAVLLQKCSKKIENKIWKTR